MGLLTQGVEERNLFLKLGKESKDLPVLSAADERLIRQDPELLAANKAKLEALNVVHALGLDFTTALQAKGPEVRRYFEILRKTNELKDAKRMARQQRGRERDAAKKDAILAKAASNIDGRDAYQVNEYDVSSMQSSRIDPLRPSNEPRTTYENATMGDKHRRAVFRTITNARASGLPFEVMDGSVVVKCPLDVNANAVDYRLSQRHLAPSKMPEGTKGSVFVEFPHASQHMASLLHCQATATGPHGISRGCSSPRQLQDHRRGVWALGHHRSLPTRLPRRRHVALLGVHPQLRWACGAYGGEVQHGCQLARSARHHHAISRSDPRAGARGGDGTARRAEGDGHEGIGRWTASFEVVGAGNNIGLPPAPARLDDGRKLDGVFAMYANTGKFVMGYQDRNVKDLPMRFYEVKFAVARPVTIWTLYNFCRASIGLATAPRK